MNINAAMNSTGYVQREEEPMLHDSHSPTSATLCRSMELVSLMAVVMRAVHDFCILQREQISSSGQIPLAQHLAEQLVHPGPGLGQISLGLLLPSLSPNPEYGAEELNGKRVLVL
ncbi:hypothetical protein INR49_018709, partial [Caranx melampygus]